MEKCVVNTTFTVIGDINVLWDLQNKMSEWFNMAIPEYRGSNWGSGLNIDFFQDSLIDGIYPPYCPGSLTKLHDVVNINGSTGQFRFEVSSGGNCAELFKEFVKEWAKKPCHVFWQMNELGVAA